MIAVEGAFYRHCSGTLMRTASRQVVTLEWGETLVAEVLPPGEGLVVMMPVPAGPMVKGWNRITELEYVKAVNEAKRSHGEFPEEDPAALPESRRGLRGIGDRLRLRLTGGSAPDKGEDEADDDGDEESGAPESVGPRSVS